MKEYQTVVVLDLGQGTAGTRSLWTVLETDHPPTLAEALSRAMTVPDFVRMLEIKPENISGPVTLKVRTGRWCDRWVRRYVFAGGPK